MKNFEQKENFKKTPNLGKLIDELFKIGTTDQTKSGEIIGKIYEQRDKVQYLHPDKKSKLYRLLELPNISKSQDQINELHRLLSVETLSDQYLDMLSKYDNLNIKYALEGYEDHEGQKVDFVQVKVKDGKIVIKKYTKLDGDVEGNGWIGDRADLAVKKLKAKIIPGSKLTVNYSEVNGKFFINGKESYITAEMIQKIQGRLRQASNNSVKAVKDITFEEQPLDDENRDADNYLDHELSNIV